MGAVRFTCGGASAEELAELERQLAALDETEILESGEAGGAAFAEVIVVALIGAGVPIVYDAVKTFATWLAKRKKGSAAVGGPVKVTVEGVEGAFTFTFTSGAEIPKAKLAAVGTVTDVRQAR
jgi:hypothetical protein